MSKVKTYQIEKAPSFLQDMLLLMKHKLSLTVVFTSIMAYLIAAGSQASLKAVAILSIGGFLVAGAANALNQALEKDFDSMMTRTMGRPVAAGRMKMSDAVLAAGLMSLVGISMLAYFNPWTAFLGTISLVIYAFLYTPLKRVTPISIVVGAIPGALPAMIGAVAFEGEITILATCLFGIQFLWQFPHFWSIGFLSFDDYKKAGYKFLQEENGKLSKQVAKYSVLYALALIPLSLVPAYAGIVTWISSILVAAFSLVYFGFSMNFYNKFNRASALKLMFSSFGYILIVFAILLIDVL